MQTDGVSVEPLEPTFDVPIVNISVVASQTALLPCSIEHLGNYVVVWMDKNQQILSMDDKRIVEDQRISVFRPFIKEWNLQIRDISYEDRGEYRCTINTSPVKSKIVILRVKVPPQILEDLSSNDVTVREGDTVQLVCNATGIPQPSITWYRLPSKERGGEKEQIGLSGEMIIIHNVSRYCDDYYECTASNGVPPQVGRKMKVSVHFPPEVRLTTKRLGQLKGKTTILECKITAYPHARSFWSKGTKEITGTSNKYTIEAFEEGSRTITLSLTIEDLREEDFGQYKCVASNGLGSDEAVMTLYEYTPPKPIVPEVKTTKPTRAPYNDNRYHKTDAYNKQGDANLINTPGPSYKHDDPIQKSRTYNKGSLPESNGLLLVTLITISLFISWKS